MDESFFQKQEHNQAQIQACLNLWAAKLLAFRDDYLRGSPEEKNYAAWWIFLSKDTSIGSFSWICSLFGLDETRVKKSINPVFKDVYKSTTAVINMESENVI